jgi:uncharacterized membrane protein (DUF2068 family)
MATADKAKEEHIAATGKNAKTDAHHRHNKGLVLVALFKLSKAIFFGAMGVGALHLLHRNLGDLVLRLVSVLPFDPEGHFVSLLMDRADLIGNHELRQVGLFSLLYACVCIVEGTGLYLERVWAEYFTIALTILALPWDLWELYREFTLFRLALLILNLAVLAYLVWLIRRVRRASHRRKAVSDTTSEA